MKTAQCCTYVMLPERPLTLDESWWLSLHGLTEEAPRGQRIDAVCRALDADGRCILVGTSQRPELCGKYPELPGLDDGCSYAFERVLDGD